MTTSGLIVIGESDMGQYFFESLKEVISPAQRKQISTEETRYCACALRFFAKNMLTIEQPTGTSTFVTLHDVFEDFIVIGKIPANPEDQELIACFLLLMTGYYRRQLSSDHDLRVFVEFGRKLFTAASNSPEMFGRRRILRQTSKKFHLWQDILEMLQHHFLWNSRLAPYDRVIVRQLKPF